MFTRRDFLSTAARTAPAAWLTAGGTGELREIGGSGKRQAKRDCAFAEPRLGVMSGVLCRNPHADRD
jgi:hypothetical protein